MENQDNIQLQETTPAKDTSALASFHFLLGKMSKDMSFVGIFVIIYGAIYCLTIIGALIGVPLIYAGLEMRRASEHFGIYNNSNQSSFLISGFESQGKFFRIFKILIIVGLVILGIMLVVLILSLSFLLGSAGSVEG